ncbi:serine/threonine protein kinase [Ureibacillus aquaedulcis]|uniref:serine/threonine protein kinase n=1 Tax=Ureibacillus aquaedulcis TaxID=3058421 RepID=UPI0031F2F453
MRAIRKFYQFFVDKPFEIGAILNDRYEILRVIGTGSYGIVYLCKELITNENRVVKQLRPSKCRNKKEVEMFEKEISLLRKLDHKKIPMLYEAFSSNGQLFYAMSFVEGDNLEELIFSKKITFSEKEALLVLADLLEFIDYLHKKDIYHQDLRIPNVLLKNRELYLIDLGLAKSPNRQKDLLDMKQQDYYDLGEILLYLLYTTYSSNNKKALPWTEELSLEKETVHLLKRLLEIEDPYSSTREISIDLETALKAMEKHINLE